MDNLLHHPFRVALTLTGFLCALSSLTFFGGAAPVTAIPFIPITFQFIRSPQKTLIAIGWLMLFLLIVSFCLRRIEIEAFQFEEVVIYGGPLLLLLAGLHRLVLESRKDRTSDAKS